MKYIFILLLLFTSFAGVSAHPGRTAGDGCHYCRTNCTRWGETYGARHCHNGGSSTRITTTTTTTSNSYNNSYQPRTVTCGRDECKHNNRCYTKPDNAYCTPSDSYNAWMCDNGYEEVGSSCIRIEEEEDDDEESYDSPISFPVDDTPPPSSSSSIDTDSGGGGAGGWIIGFLLGILGYWVYGKSSSK